MDNPNILMLISHDTGRFIGSYGYKVDTPALDELARNGVMFDEYYCPAPQCSPSRSSILTGLYPHNNGMIGLAHLGFCIRPGVTTLPMEFSRAGYESALIGLSHETINEAPPIADRIFSSTYELGYETVVDVEGDRAALVADETINFLKTHESSDRPFYLNVGFFETHRDFEEYEPVADDPSEVEIFGFLDDTDNIRRDIANFNGSVKTLDKAIGRILDELKSSPLNDNTIVVYTTDHGAAFPGAKGTLKRAGLETALIISLPGVHEPLISNDLLCNIDLMPTLLDLCGLPVPEGLDGTSFASVFKDSTERCCERQGFFTEMTWHDKYHPMRGYRTKDFAYVLNLEDGPKVYVTVDGHLSPSGKDMNAKFEVPNEPEELYDLKTDALEQHNLADDPAYADILHDMRNRVLKWMHETNDPILSGPIPGTPSSRWAAEIEAGNAYPGRARYYARLANMKNQ